MKHEGPGCRSWVRRLIFLMPLAFAVFIVLPARASDDDGDSGGVKFSPKAEATFKQRCSACHTYGKGVKVGPDLKGVNERRKRDWLLKFIHSSSTVIKSGDPTATALFAQFKQQRMPDWTDLSDQDIKDILDYFAVGGPDIKPADERNAETATPEEEEMGRKLFFGEIRFKYGAQSCAACHSVSTGGMRGGSLGPNLSKVYMSYRDMALTSFLRHPCFKWDPALAGSDNHYLTAKESFAVKSFLRHESMKPQNSNGVSWLQPAGGINRAETAVTGKPLRAAMAAGVEKGGLQ